MEVSGEIHYSAALPPGKSLCYPMDIGLSGPQNCSERGSRKDNPCFCFCYPDVQTILTHFGNLATLNDQEIEDRNIATIGWHI